MSASRLANPLSAYSQSTSHIAMMFSEARFTMLLRPWPPTPTAATFSLSLGAVKPRPSTCRGTMAKPADVAATRDTNLRLEILAIVMSPIALTDKHSDDTPDPSSVIGRGLYVFEEDSMSRFVIRALVAALAFILTCPG